MKLYIAVLDVVPAHMVPVVVAHAVLNANAKFSSNPAYVDWYLHSFKKCVVGVNQKEFDKISQMDRIFIGHENKTNEGKPCCIVICPRQEYPNVIKFAKLWVP